jgi:hypothetical protein
MKLLAMLLAITFMITGSMQAMENQQTEQSLYEKICPYGFCCYQSKSEKGLVHWEKDTTLLQGFMVRKRKEYTASWILCCPCMAIALCIKCLTPSQQ